MAILNYSINTTNCVAVDCVITDMGINGGDNIGFARGIFTGIKG